MDHVRFRHRPGDSGLFGQPTEYEPTAGRGAAVEAASDPSLHIVGGGVNRLPR